jgi:hypothetical protein
MRSEVGEMLDTSQAARRRYYELRRRLTPEERAREAAALSRAARELALAGIRQREPGAPIGVRLAALLYGEATAARLAGRLPSEL